MNLDDAIKLVGNRTDYNPNTTGYIDAVADLINDAYRAFAAAQTWLWAQREVEVVAHADVEATLTAVAGSANIGAVAAVFAAWMEGHLIEINGVEYEIVQVDSTTSAWIDTAITTSTGDIGTIKQRYMDLPADCVEVLGVTEVERTEGQATRGRVAPLARLEGELFGLDFAQTGAPDRWLPADPAVVVAPALPGTLSTTAGTAWTAGVYKFRVGFKYGERYSEPCPTELSHTAVSTSAVVPVITLPSTGAGSGYKYTIYCKPPNFRAWRVYQDNIVETGGAVTLTTAPGVAWAAPSRARAPEGGGVNQRIRLWPRTDADRTFTVRYLRRVPKLLELADTPVIPEPHQSIVVPLALVSVYEKKGDNVSKREAERQMRDSFIAMQRRYLTSGARRWVKGSWTDAPSGPPNRTLTHLG